VELKFGEPQQCRDWHRLSKVQLQYFPSPGIIAVEEGSRVRTGKIDAEI
jgi:hypothetical protein